MAGGEQGESGQMVNNHGPEEGEADPGVDAEPIPDAREFAHEHGHNYSRNGAVEAVDDPATEGGFKVGGAEHLGGSGPQEKGDEAEQADADGQAQELAPGELEAEKKSDGEEDVEDFEDREGPGLEIEARHSPGEVLHEEEIFEMGADEL